MDSATHVRPAREAVGDVDQMFLVAQAEEDPVIRGRSDQQHGGCTRGEQSCEVRELLELGELGEPGRQGRREQEREEHLHVGLRDPDFLHELDEVAVAALELGLVAPRAVASHEGLKSRRSHPGCLPGCTRDQAHRPSQLSGDDQGAAGGAQALVNELTTERDRPPVLVWAVAWDLRFDSLPEIPP